MVQVGDLVRLKALPAGFDQWQSGRMTEVFRCCLGRVYRVDEIDAQGLFVLDVSADIDSLFGDFMNDIRVEEECLEVIVRSDEC
jgi:hypothetical protein